MAMNLSTGRRPGEAAQTYARLIASIVPPLADELIERGPGRVYREAVAVLERALLKHALEVTDGNQLRAARLLGLNRNTLHKRCRSLGLLPDRAPRVGSTSPV